MDFKIFFNQIIFIFSIFFHDLCGMPLYMYICTCMHVSMYVCLSALDLFWLNSYRMMSPLLECVCMLTRYILTEQMSVCLRNWYRCWLVLKNCQMLIAAGSDKMSCILCLFIYFIWEPRERLRDQSSIPTYLGARNSVHVTVGSQGPSYLILHLLLCRGHVNKKLGLGVKLGLEPRPCGTCCRHPRQCVSTVCPRLYLLS